MFKILAGIISGPAGVISAWFTSTFGRIIGVLALLGVIGAGITVGYLSWEHTVKAAEDAKYQLAAKDAIIKNRDSEIKILKAQETIQADEAKKQAASNAAINAQTGSVEEWIKAHKGGDRPASEVLTTTVNKVSKPIKHRHHVVKRAIEVQ